MWRSILAPLTALLVMGIMFMQPALAQRPGERPGGWRGAGAELTRTWDKENWVLLGSRRVRGIGIDRNVFDVAQQDWFFDRIRIAARGDDVFILYITIVFGNGQTQRIDVFHRLAAGNQSPDIDLIGDVRKINRVEITARTRASWQRRAIIDVYAQRAINLRVGWELLGKQSVGFGIDRDTIRVGRREGRFDKILVQVQGNDVEFRALRVYFGNGTSQDVDVSEFIRAGRRSRALDLAGGDRFIDHVDLIYRSRPGFGGRAVVEVYGRSAVPKWDELGCKKVGFGIDRDVIAVGRREGRFSAIRLRAADNAINMIDLKVVYDRGPPDDIPVRSEIRAGGETRPLDLRGERRAINRVELVYASKPSFRGQATVCVDGRQ